MRRLPVRGAVFAIELYRAYVSPLRLPTCRFMPTCSQYAVDALNEHGVIRGGWLAAVRLAKCGPWHRGGWDPIPRRAEAGTSAQLGDGDRPAGRSATRTCCPDRITAGNDSWVTPASRGESKSVV